MPFPTRVYRILQNDPMKINPDNIWEVGSMYVVTGPTSKIFNPWPVDAVNGLQLPYKGTPHPENAFLIADNVDVNWLGSNDAQGDMWECNVSWRSAGALTATPEPLEWQWDQGILSEQFDHDRDGNAYVNTASDPLQGGFPDDVILPILRVWRTQPTYDPGFAWGISNKVNSDAMTILGLSLDKEQVRCLYSKPMTKQRHVVESIRVEYAFELKDGYKPFQPRAVDQGLMGYYHDGDNQGRGRFYFAGADDDDQDDPVPEPVLLNGLGAPIQPGGEGDDDTYVVGYSTQTTPRTFPCVQNPSVPDWIEIDPNSPDGSKVLIFKRKKTYDFRGMLPPVM